MTRCYTYSRYFAYMCTSFSTKSSLGLDWTLNKYGCQVSHPKTKILTQLVVNHLHTHKIKAKGIGGYPIPNSIKKHIAWDLCFLRHLLASKYVHGDPKMSNQPRTCVISTETENKNNDT